MTHVKDFWQDPLHAALRAMLVWQELRNCAINPNWRSKNVPWHRAVYRQCGDLLSHTGALQTAEELKVDHEAAVLELLKIWQSGLSWCLVRYGLPADSETLVQAVARKVRLAQEKVPFLKTTESLDAGADLLVEKAGAGVFSFEGFFRIARNLDIPDVGHLYCEFMAQSLIDDLRYEQGLEGGTYFTQWGDKDDLTVARELASKDSFPPADAHQRLKTDLLEAYRVVCDMLPAYAVPVAGLSNTHYFVVKRKSRSDCSTEGLVILETLSGTPYQTLTEEEFHRRAHKLPLFAS